MCVGAGLTEQWMLDNEIHLLVWQSVGDGEGFVRAAAISALTTLHASHILWHDFTQRHVAQVPPSLCDFFIRINGCKGARGHTVQS